MITPSYEETLVRQWDIIPIEKLGQDITIIGAGAVGSWTALALVKMGFANVTVYDYDTVDTANMNCQFYPIDSIGKPKVEALRDMIKMFTGIEITIHNKPFDKFTAPKGIVISAVDSMEVRKLIFQQARNNNCSWVIDPRMGAEVAQMYVMKPTSNKDEESYAKAWYSDDNAVHEKCTAKSTIYCANILSGLVAKAVKNLVADKEYARITRYDMTNNGFENWKGVLQ